MTPAERSTSVVSPRFPSADSTAFRSDSSMWATPALTLASVPKMVLTRAYTENLLSTPTRRKGALTMDLRARRRQKATEGGDVPCTTTNAFAGAAGPVSAVRSRRGGEPDGVTPSEGWRHRRSRVGGDLRGRPRLHPGGLRGAVTSSPPTPAQPEGRPHRPPDAPAPPRDGQCC